MTRPARLRSAALRGPTPFRNWSGVAEDSQRGGRCTALDDGLALADLDLPDLRGQRERIVEVDALRIARRCASSTTPAPAGATSAPARRRCPPAPARSGPGRPCVRRMPVTVTGTRPPSRLQGSSAPPDALRLADRVEVDGRRPADLPVADDRDLWVGHARRQQRPGAIGEPGVELALGDRGASQRRACARVRALPCCEMIAIFLAKASACCAREGTQRSDGHAEEQRERCARRRMRSVHRRPRGSWLTSSVALDSRLIFAFCSHIVSPPRPRSRPTPAQATEEHVLPLTKRQREILDYLNEFIQQHGYAPSLEEIGRRFNLSSLATVHKHLTQPAGEGLHPPRLEPQPFGRAGADARRRSRHGAAAARLRRRRRADRSRRRQRNDRGARRRWPASATATCCASRATR